MDITLIVEALLALLAATITLFLVPWLRNHTSAQQRIELVEWTLLAMQAAERIFKGRGRGDAKRAYVLRFLERKGFSIQYDGITHSARAVIEALMSELQQVDKEE